MLKAVHSAIAMLHCAVAHSLMSRKHTILICGVVTVPVHLYECVLCVQALDAFQAALEAALEGEVSNEDQTMRRSQFRLHA